MDWLSRPRDLFRKRGAHGIRPRLRHRPICCPTIFEKPSPSPFRSSTTAVLPPASEAARTRESGRAIEGGRNRRGPARTRAEERALKSSMCEAVAHDRDFTIDERANQRRALAISHARLIEFRGRRRLPNLPMHRARHRPKFVRGSKRNPLRGGARAWRGCGVRINFGRGHERHLPGRGDPAFQDQRKAAGLFRGGGEGGGAGRGAATDYIIGVGPPRSAWISPAPCGCSGTRRCFKQSGCVTRSTACSELCRFEVGRAEQRIVGTNPTRLPVAHRRSPSRIGGGVRAAHFGPDQTGGRYSHQHAVASPFARELRMPLVERCLRGPIRISIDVGAGGADITETGGAQAAAAPSFFSEPRLEFSFSASTMSTGPRALTRRVVIQPSASMQAADWPIGPMIPALLMMMSIG